MQLSSTSRTGLFTPGERTPGTDLIGGSVSLSWFWRFGEEENILSLPGIESRIVRLVDKSLHLSILSRLQYSVKLMLKRGSIQIFLVFSQHCKEAES
jgi:hypothetical protein